MIASTTKGRSSTLPIWAMMVGSLFSTFGNQLTALAIPWFVLETTGSASKTGLVAAVTLLPTILSSVFSGTIVDRLPHKSLAIGSDIISGITIAAVPLFYATTGLSFTGLVILMFFGAVFDGPGSTARSAMIPALARRADMPLELVNSRLGAIGSATQLFGAPIAGVLIALMGAANILWLNAATFAISAFMISAFVPAISKSTQSTNSFLSDVREGFSFFVTNRVLLAVGLLATGINFLISPLFGVTIPYFAKTVYESSTKLGLMMGGVGLGGLLGALAYGYLGTRFSRRAMLLTTLACFCLPVWFMPLQPPVAVMIGLMLVIGFGSGLVNPMAVTMIQLGTPEHMLGRVMGTLSSFAMVASPIGLLLGGAMIGTMGLNSALIGIAAALTLMLAAGVLHSAFRELDSLAEPVQSDRGESNIAPSDAATATS